MGVMYFHGLTSYQPEAVANGANYTDSKYQAILGAATPFIGRVVEVFVGGEATSSTVNILKVARDSTHGGTLSGGVTSKLNPSSPTNQATAFSIATTKPQRGAQHLLNLSLNAFGGIIRWVSAPGEELYFVANAVNQGEVSLSGFTGSGTGSQSSHIQWEEL
jgi:hypothetical protein